MLRMLQMEKYEDSADMTAPEKARYSACALLVLTSLQKVSGCTVVPDAIFSGSVRLLSGAADPPLATTIS